MTAWCRLTCASSGVRGPASETPESAPRTDPEDKPKPDKTEGAAPREEGEKKRSRRRRSRRKPAASAAVPAAAGTAAEAAGDAAASSGSGTEAAKVEETPADEAPAEQPPARRRSGRRGGRRRSGRGAQAAGNASENGGAANVKTDEAAPADPAPAPAETPQPEPETAPADTSAAGGNGVSAPAGNGGDSQPDKDAGGWRAGRGYRPCRRNPASRFRRGRGRHRPPETARLVAEDRQVARPPGVQRFLVTQSSRRDSASPMSLRLPAKDMRT